MPAHSFRLAMFLTSITTVPLALGQVREWDGFDGLWDSDFNWTPADVPDTTAEIALLSGTAPYTSTLDISATNTLGRLLFTNPNATLRVRPLSVLRIDQSANNFFDTVNEGTIRLESGNVFQRGQLEIIARPDNTSLIVTNTRSGVIDLDQSNDGTVTVPILRTAGFRVSHGAFHEIRGNGRFDIDSTEFVNNGDIEAEDDNESLRIFTAPGSTLVNNDDIFATGSAILRLQATIVQGASGDIFAEDDAVIEIEGDITGGDILTADDSAARTIGQLTLRDLRIDADFTADHELTLVGRSITNDDIITKTDTADDSADHNIIAGGNIEFRGTGTMTLAGGSTLGVFNNDPQTITNGVGHTIAGNGVIDADIVNNGTLLSLGPGSIFRLNSDTIAQSATGVIDTSSYFVRATPRTGNRTTISGGTITGTTAGILTGYVDIIDELELAGVTLDGAQVLMGETDQLFLSDVTLNPAPNPYFRYSSGSPTQTITLDGNITNNGTFNLASQANQPDVVLLVREPVTIDGGGELVGDRGVKSVIRSDSSADVLTNAPGHTIRGGLILEAAVLNRGTIVAQGTSDINGNTNLITLNTLDKTNRGLITAVGDARILIIDIDITQTSTGVIEIADGAIIFASLFATPRIEGGTIRSSGIGRFELERLDTGILDSVTLDADSLIRGTALIDGDLTHNGTMELNRIQPSDDPGTLLFRQTARLDGKGTIVFQTPTAGELVVDPGKALTIEQGQTLAGGPRLNGEIEFRGTLDPDGTVTELRGPAFTLTPSATVILTVGVVSGGPFDDTITRPDSDTVISLAGELVVDVINEQLMSPGDEFILITPGAPVGGTFDTVTFNGIDTPDFPGFDLVYEAESVKLVVRDAGPCNPADLAEPFGVVDLSDVDAFIAAFLVGDAAADLAPPAGVVDLSDVDAFIAAFLAGCP